MGAGSGSQVQQPSCAHKSHSSLAGPGDGRDALWAQQRDAGHGGAPRPAVHPRCSPCNPCSVLRLLSPRPSLLNAASEARLNSSPQKPLDLKQLKQRAAAIPPIVSAGTGSELSSCVGWWELCAGKVLRAQRVPSCWRLPAVFECPSRSCIRKWWEVWTEQAAHCHVTAASFALKSNQAPSQAVLPLVSCA